MTRSKCITGNTWEKFINPFTDFGFKKLFGSEGNKEFLISFLNELLREEGKCIKELTFLTHEQLGNTPIDRKTVFDLYCINDDGERFIVEVQKARQEFFVDRTLFYSTYAIQEQAPKGDWLFELRAVYTISILDFIFDNKSEDFLHRVKLANLKSQEVFYDRLTFIYLEMPKFKKEEDEVENDFDRWLYLLKNMALLEELPVRFQQKLFKSFLHEAAILNLSPIDLKSYQSSVKSLRDSRLF